MTFTVVAPCVIAKDQEGRQHHSYQGDKISWLSPEQAKYFLDENLVVKDGAAAQPEPEGAETNGDKPGEDAHKPELVAWVYANVAKADGGDYTKAELGKMSPEELRAIVDSVE